MKKERQRNLEIWLNDWAEFEFLRNPHRTTTVEATAGQGRSPNKPGSRVPKGAETPAMIARVHTAVKQLGDFHPELRFVIILKYCRQQDGRPRNMQAQHKTFRAVTEKGARTYNEWLGKAHAWLDGRLA